MARTAAAAGFRMPAEWEPQEAVWLSWPLTPVLWKGRRRQVDRALAAFAAALTRFVRVRINLAAAAHQRVAGLLAAAGADPARVAFYDHPCNDAWCRDHGPVFLRRPRDGAMAVLHFLFNAWGGKVRPWDLDEAIPAHIAAALGIPRFPVPLVAEGGALETNGAGVLVTTASVLLNPNRNPGIPRRRVEALLRGALGVERIWWLPGGLAGDDTDGHVDNLARFCAPDALLYAAEDNVNGLNHAALRANRNALARCRLPDGRRPELVPLPLPDPIRPRHWRLPILPASYANFLVVNRAVLVPTFRQPANDRAALRRIAACFPGREVVGLDCFDILYEGGALHCLSQQQPA